MRLDKYLQVTRLVKRRELARELCEEGRLALNGRPAKPGREVKPGDAIDLAFWRRRLRVRVIACPAGNLPRGEAHLLYEVVEDRPVEEDLLSP